MKEAFQAPVRTRDFTLLPRVGAPDALWTLSRWDSVPMERASLTGGQGLCGWSPPPRRTHVGGSALTLGAAWPSGFQTCSPGMWEGAACPILTGLPPFFPPGVWASLQADSLSSDLKFLIRLEAREGSGNGIVLSPAAWHFTVGVTGTLEAPPFFF